MKILALLTLLFLAGCAQLQTAIPSLNSCQHVTYTRDGLKIHIEGDCQL